MNHTEEFNKIMERGKKPRSPKPVKVEVKLIGARDNMNAMQTDLSKCTIYGNTVSLPFEQLPNYAEVRKALLNAGATYNRSKFIFPTDAQPYIDRLMSGESVNIKKEFQFFGTPKKWADYVVECANIKEGCKVLEPSAGQGALIEAIYRSGLGFNVVVDYYELMDANRVILNSKVYTGATHVFKGEDFLTAPAYPMYHRIIANPPFTKNQDIDHIKKMYNLLYDGGRIVTIASNSWRTGSQKKQIAFREWLDEINAVVEDIPAGEFKESGTNIATCLIIIDK